MGLKLKCQSCNCGEISDSLIRDGIVMGVRDNVLRDKLIGENKLTLERAIQMCQAREVTQSRIWSMDSGVLSDIVCKVEYVSKGRATAKWLTAKDSTDSSQQHTSGNQPSYGSCGGEYRPCQCPVYRKECYNCGMSVTTVEPLRTQMQAAETTKYSTLCQ